MKPKSKQTSKAESLNQFAVEVFYHQDGGKNTVRDFYPLAVTPESIEEHRRRTMYVCPPSATIDLAKTKMPAAFGDRSLLDVIKKYCKKFDLNISSDKDPVTAYFMSASFLIAQTYDGDDKATTPKFSVPSKKEAKKLLIYFPLDGSSKIKTANPLSDKITLDRAHVVIELEFKDKTVHQISAHAINPVIVDCAKEPDLDTNGEPKYRNRDQANKKLYDRMYTQADAIIQIFNQGKAYTSEDFFDALNGYLKQRYQVQTFDTRYLVPAIFHRAANLINTPLCSISYHPEHTAGIDLYLGELDQETVTDTLNRLKNTFGSSFTPRDNNRGTTIRIPYAAVFENMHLLHSAADTIFSDKEILAGYQKNTKKHGYGAEPDLAAASRDALEAQKRRARLESSAKILTAIAKNIHQQGSTAEPKLKRAKFTLTKKLDALAEKALRPDCTQEELAAASHQVRQGIAEVEGKLDNAQTNLFKKNEKKTIKQAQRDITYKRW